MGITPDEVLATSIELSRHPQSTSIISTLLLSMVLVSKPRIVLPIYLASFFRGIIILIFIFLESVVSTEYAPSAPLLLITQLPASHSFALLGPNTTSLTYCNRHKINP